MIPQPIVVGLTLCERIIVEEGTKSLSLIDCFVKLQSDTFPTPSRPLCLYAAPQAVAERVLIELTVTHLDTDEVIVSGRRQIRF